MARGNRLIEVGKGEGFDSVAFVAFEGTGSLRQLLASHHLKTHPHSERIDDAILGDDLYDRNEVDSLAPYATIRGPSDMREASIYEPDLLQ